MSSIHTSQNSDPMRLVAQDFASFYHSIDWPVTCMDDFDQQWCKFGMDALLWAGTHLTQGSPTGRPDVTRRILLFLSSYISMADRAFVPHATPFGLLCYYQLYFLGVNSYTAEVGSGEKGGGGRGARVNPNFQSSDLQIPFGLEMLKGLRQCLATPMPGPGQMTNQNPALPSWVNQAVGSPPAPNKSKRRAMFGDESHGASSGAAGSPNAPQELDFLTQVWRDQFNLLKATVVALDERQAFRLVPQVNLLLDASLVTQAHAEKLAQLEAQRALRVGGGPSLVAAPSAQGTEATVGGNVKGSASEIQEALRDYRSRTSSFMS